MTKISSGSTFIAKRFFPVIWFGVLGAILLATVFGRVRGAVVAAVALPLIMAVIGYLLMKKVLWDLADEVYDCGDFLLVQKGRQEEQVPLSNIINVAFDPLQNANRVTLRLGAPGRFGQEISFYPAVKMSLNPFAKNLIIEDLIVRVDEARRHRI